MSMSPAGLPDGCSLFINLHPRELHDAALMHEEALNRWAPRLVFEITETAAIEDYERVRTVIKALRAHGSRIALDVIPARATPGSTRWRSCSPISPRLTWP